MNEYILEIKEYLKENKMSQSSLAKKLGVSPSVLSACLSGKTWFNTSSGAGHAIYWFLKPIRIAKNRSLNLEKYGYSFTDDEIDKVKILRKMIQKSLDENKQDSHVFLYENWYEENIPELIIFIHKNNIQIKLDNYHKTGLYTDSDEHVNIYLT